MNNKEIISILTNIESNIDVNSLTYKGYCVWPYIRNQIATYLAHKDRQRSTQIICNKNKCINIASTIQKIVSYFGSLIKNWRHQRVTTSEVIFLARTSERCNLVEGKWYNPHCDSFSDLFEKKYSIQLLEFSNDGKFPDPQHRPSYHLDFHLFINRIKFMLLKRFLFVRIQNFRTLENFLKEVGIFPAFSEKSLRSQIELMLFQKKLFSKIIRTCRPKLFFIVCYYYDIAMSAILACHDQRIPVVEFQHGAQNDNNPYLTHWSKVPKQGYEMLPDFFWNWGKASANRINKWAKSTDKHKTFIGGNLWISKWVNENFQTDECSKYNTRDIFPKGYKHILISLQLWPDSFPEYLFEIINNSPQEWFWHIRQHPRHRVSQEDLEKCFLSLPNIHIEEQYSRDMPLYLLLKHIDLHLTGFSTVAFEAAFFKIPTIFFHVNAKEDFYGLFDNSLFFFAENNEEMLYLLKKILSKKPRSNYKSSYINADPRVHFLCMEEMIAVAQRRNTL
jgi:hypothetical protein